MPRRHESAGRTSVGAEFDRIASEYRAQHEANISLSGENSEYFARYKARDLHRSVTSSASSGSTTRVLDFGAGIGNSIPHLVEYFPDARITCIDVSSDSLAIARERNGDAVDYAVFDGAMLPLADASIDATIAACVFHHIAPGAREPLLRELHRVTRPGGCLMVYEHNPLNPLTRHAVRTCPFDENAILIRAREMRTLVLGVGFREARLRYRVFFPHALSLLRPLETLLTWLPLGAQYYVCARR